LTNTKTKVGKRGDWGKVKESNETAPGCRPKGRQGEKKHKK